MLGYFVCFMIGVAITYMIFLNTNGSLPMNRNLVAEELGRQKAALSKLESQMASHSEIISAQTTRSIEQKSSLEKHAATLRDYEKSFDLIHRDYLSVNAHVAKVERRFAALTPIHYHFEKDLPAGEGTNAATGNKRRVREATV